MDKKYNTYISIEENLVWFLHSLSKKESPITKEDLNNFLKLCFLVIIKSEDNPFTAGEILFFTKIIKFDNDELKLRACFGKGMRKELVSSSISIKTLANEMELPVAMVDNALCGVSSMYLMSYLKFLEALNNIKKT